MQLMITINRGAEPPSLRTVRDNQLAVLRSLGRPPSSGEIVGYRVVADDLWRIQHNKCCYCEMRIRRDYNDVEHFRPKATASRLPGCTSKHGYWWLAYTWDNMLYACPGCNRSEKNDRFPLREGSIALIAEQTPPRKERSLLLDPAGTECPGWHISYSLSSPIPGSSRKHWYARARNGSRLGAFTIDVVGLNVDELLELRDNYVSNYLEEPARRLRDALVRNDRRQITDSLSEAKKLMRATRDFSLLAYDVFRHFAPPLLMKHRKLGWPSPHLLCI